MSSNGGLNMLARPVASAAAFCWFGEITFERCCLGDIGVGHAACWEPPAFTWETCCRPQYEAEGVALRELPVFRRELPGGRLGTWSGDAGIRFVAESSFTVARLGRSNGGAQTPALAPGGELVRYPNETRATANNVSARVTLWSVETGAEIASVLVVNGDGLGASAALDVPVVLAAGKEYRLSQQCHGSAGIACVVDVPLGSDKALPSAPYFSSQMLSVRFLGGATSPEFGFPADVSEPRRVGLVNLWMLGAALSDSFKAKLPDMLARRSPVTGAWGEEDYKHHIYSKCLSRGLGDFFLSRRVRSVMDLGAGLGYYTAALGSLGIDARCFDGNPATSRLTAQLCGVLDLTASLSAVGANASAESAEYVLSLEVAEHVPKHLQSKLIDNLVARARRGLVLSWAIPGQGGYRHVNERSNEYVIELFKRKRFKFNAAASRELRKASAGPGCCCPWFAETLLVMERVRSSPWNKTNADRRHHPSKNQ
eukprot:TRINITY_DN24324_c0_g1_i1.p1 TRINITY_DN24324_c0_g1~~TRINITY_DN24324_c0_g1_i1.p1  ORF type:complete len:483 (-),score=61.49 TRINITY_DN24324_c0_g1_i1:74-1522(-)